MSDPIALGSQLPSKLMVPILQTLCYPWCTSRLLQKEMLDCHLCGAGRQEHYAVCVAMWRWAGGRLGVQVTLEAPDGHHLNRSAPFVRSLAGARFKDLFRRRRLIRGLALSDAGARACTAVRA